MMQMISSLEPVPARGFSEQETEYITPDVYVRKQGEDFLVFLNHEGVPDLKISRSYEDQFRIQSEASKKEVLKYIGEKKQSGQWFIRSLMQRQETIKKVTKSLIDLQRDFFDTGDISQMKPLILQDVASDIDMHTSTISRVTSSKYVSTPYGLMSLKSFFHTGLKNRYGDMISAGQIQRKIQELIENENSEAPLTDGDLLKILSEELAVPLSRRTVHAYRSNLNIPSYFERRKNPLTKDVI